MGIGDVEEVCEVLDAEGTEVFDVVYGEAIRASSTRVAAFPDGLDDVVR